MFFPQSIRGLRASPAVADFVGVLLRPCLATCQTRSAIATGEDVGIGFVKIVAALALCLSGIHCASTVAAKQVGQRSDGFEMVGINALLSTAQVVDLHSGRNRAYEKLVRKSVSHEKTIVEVESPIFTSRSVVAPAPYPARRGALNRAPEAPNVSDCYIHTFDFTITRTT